MEKSLKESIKELKQKKKKAALGGGRDRIKKQHDKGRLTARERIELLLADSETTGKRHQEGSTAR